MSAPLTPTPQVPLACVCLLDFDGTLFSTDHLRTKYAFSLFPSYQPSSELLQECKQLDSAIEQLFFILKPPICEKVVIVTNSEEKWVDMVAERYLPFLWSKIKDQSVTIQATNYPREVIKNPSLQPHVLKQKVMEQILKEFKQNLPFASLYRFRAMSIGDALSDREASEKACKTEQIDWWSFKIKERATTEELCASLQYLARHMILVVTTCGHLSKFDVRLEANQGNKTTTT